MVLQAFRRQRSAPRYIRRGGLPALNRLTRVAPDDPRLWLGSPPRALNQSGLCLIVVRLGKTLRSVKRLGSFEVLFSLRMLRNCGFDLRTGFVRLIFQVLSPYLRQYSSFGDVISDADISNATVGWLDLLYVGDVTGRSESNIDLSKGNKR